MKDGNRSCASPKNHVWDYKIYEDKGEVSSTFIDLSSENSSSTTSDETTPEENLLSLAHEEYRASSFQKALIYCMNAYDRDSKRTDTLLLLGAIYYQLADYDMCILKNKEAIRLDPYFAECYGNMANALKEKGELDSAIQYYLTAIKLRPNFCDAWNNLASAYLRKGNLQEASDCCKYALRLNPKLVDAHINLGNMLKSQGFPIKALECYMKAIEINPSFAIAWSNMAGLFMDEKKYKEALMYFQKAIQLRPTFADAYLNLGNVLKALGRPNEAISSYLRAIQLKPSFAIAYGNLGNVLHELSFLDLACVHYKQAIALDPNFLEAYNNLGNAYKDLGRIDDAMLCYKACLLLQPKHPQALTNLGNIFFEWNRLDEAVVLYKQAITVSSGMVAPFTNLAVILKQRGLHAVALNCYSQVLTIEPNSPDCYVNRGNTLKEMGRLGEAIQDYAKAVVIKPDMPEAHANLASAYKDSGQIEAAIQSYQKAIYLRNDFPEAICNLIHTLQCVCDWEDRNTRFKELEKVIKSQLKLGVLPSVQPFHAIAYPIDPLLALQISQSYADHAALLASRFRLRPFTHPSPLPIHFPNGSKRLRIGYVSSDFGNHPLSHLMSSVFGMHDRQKIEVFCYALTPNDGSEWRKRISEEAEHFLDVSELTSDRIACQIVSDKIQILVNLNGYTKGARNEIFSLNPSPVQISYMGFPGTMGAKYIHYLVTDKVVSPPQYAHYYSEKLVYLPHSYFVNDYKQKNLDALDSSNLPKRSDLGLPEKKFIFACFNQLYKMDPDIFSTWCNILKRVPNSVLWLLRFPAAGETRLKQFAVKQGVKEDRIIFMDVAQKHEHIKRSSLADLFLDSPLCNAHTTGVDVLWAGVPLLTLPLQKMATRVAASLCAAAGFQKEMVVTNMKEYEERAVMFATRQSSLSLLRKKLADSRMSSPLFDTKRWVKNLERCYFRMWKLHCEGKTPESFKVEEDDELFPRA